MKYEQMVSPGKSIPIDVVPTPSAYGHVGVTCIFGGSTSQAIPIWMMEFSNIFIINKDPTVCSIVQTTTFATSRTRTKHNHAEERQQGLPYVCSNGPYSTESHVKTNITLLVLTIIL